MIRHVVAFSLRDSLSEEERADVLAATADLPQHHPTMRRFALGPNISTRDQTFGYAFSAEFETEAELLAYLESEHHERFVAEQFAPSIERRAIVSFEAPAEG